MKGCGQHLSYDCGVRNSLREVSKILWGLKEEVARQYVLLDSWNDFLNGCSFFWGNGFDLFFEESRSDFRIDFSVGFLFVMLLNALDNSLWAFFEVFNVEERFGINHFFLLIITIVKIFQINRQILIYKNVKISESKQIILKIRFMAFFMHISAGGGLSQPIQGTLSKIRWCCWYICPWILKKSHPLENWNTLNFFLIKYF